MSCRKYKKCWEEETWAKGWLMHGANSILEAYCKVCRIDLRAHQADLKKHGTTKRHLAQMKKMNPLSHKQSTLSRRFILSDNEKMQDLELAMYIAIHSSIKSIDHLGDILKNRGKGSTFEQLKMHRTKCTSLIKNVISPFILEEIVGDIGDKPYSLIIDESTDVAVFKYLCFCVKYYSDRHKKIISDYLGLCIVEQTTAEALTEHIKNFLLKIKLKLKNLVGIGTDGASNLCGKHHSVYTLLKKEIPQLQLIRCICHSLNNAGNKAADQLPSNIEFLCREIYNFFHCSPLRRSLYKKTFDLLNVGVNNRKLYSFVQLSTTRWLSRYNCISVILEQWFELKQHFQLVIKNEKCYTARLINDMLCDEKNYLILLVIKPLLYEINSTNLIFQRTDLNVGKAYDNLCNLMFFLSRKIFRDVFLNNDINLIIQNLNNHLAYKAVGDCDFGAEYYKALGMIHVSPEDKFFVEQRSFNYIKSICIQIAERLPTNLEHFRKLKAFSPECCLTQLQPKFLELPFIKEFADEKQLAHLDTQWCKLREYEWVQNYGENVVKNINSFWCTVYNFQDAGESYCFRKIASFVLALLSLPTSNALVERVFSIMNTIKTKLRNRISFELLDSLIRIRLYLYARNICCHNYVVPEEMLKNFTANVVYGTVKNNSDSEENVIDVFEILNNDEDLNLFELVE